MDAIYIGIGLAFFGLTWLVVEGSPACEEAPMLWLYVLSGAVAALLLAYLAVALLKAEKF